MKKIYCLCLACLLVSVMAGAILNIGLDPVFIYVLDMGVAGAAIATAISQIISTLVYLTFVLRKKSIYNFRIKNCTFTKEIISEIFKIGIPTLVFQILTSLSISLVNTQAPLGQMSPFLPFCKTQKRPNPSVRYQELLLASFPDGFPSLL